MTALIATLAIAAIASADAPALLEAETAIAAQVSRPRALRTVRDLVALGPRMGGTGSGRRAADLVAGLMRESGLDVAIVDDPPIATHEETSWSIAVGGRRLTSAWPYGFSPSIAETTAPLAVDGEGAAAGQGPEDAARWRGKVVLTGSRIADVYDAFARGGALAVLTDRVADAGRRPGSAPIGEIDRGGGTAAPIPVFGLSGEDGLVLRSAMAGGASPVVAVSLAARIGTGRPRTVVGTLRGSGGRERGVVIVCAHGDSDSGGPGADDNASGVASLLEVGRALAWAAGAGKLPADRPTVLLIVWGAESHSSRAWVSAHADTLPRIEAVFNYDQTGSGAERDALYFEGNDIPWNAPLLRLIESIAADHAGREGFWTTYTSNPSLGGTDAYAFLPVGRRGSLRSGVEIPATTVFTAAWGRPMWLEQTPGWRSPGWPEEGDLFIDYSSFYHTSGDTPENTTDAEPWNMERCARLVALAVYRLMGRPAGAGG